MTKKEKPAADKKDDSKGPNVGLISVILSFVVGVLTILAGIFGPIIQEQIKARSQPTQTPIVIVATATDVPATPTAVPTDAVPPGAPTSTPAPTDTPVPTAAFTATPIPVGADWARDCISTLWVPYPASAQTPIRDGCYSQPLDVFFASNGRLSFLYDSRLSSAEVHGLFAPLPASGTVDLQVYLRDLKNGNLWMGVFAEPSLSAKGLLMSIPSGDVKRRPFVQWDMPGPVKILDTVTFQQSPPIYSIRFEFNNLSVRAVVMKNAFATSNVSVQSSQKWLFLGFQGVAGTNRLEAEFFNLTIAP
ncbi:MAG: hypothetical protein ACOYYF_03615 [Chloroflexota bacterium]|nr:hypothetical protein [Chloroflexota bacterium]MBI5703763.1 hypothetical protein [Chloroflexota bacterium]